MPSNDLNTLITTVIRDISGKKENMFDSAKYQKVDSSSQMVRDKYINTKAFLENENSESKNIQISPDQITRILPTISDLANQIIQDFDATKTSSKETNEVKKVEPKVGALRFIDTTQMDNKNAFEQLKPLADPVLEKASVDNKAFKFGTVGGVVACALGMYLSPTTTSYSMLAGSMVTVPTALGLLSSFGASVVSLWTTYSVALGLMQHKKEQQNMQSQQILSDEKIMDAQKNLYEDTIKAMVYLEKAAKDGKEVSMADPRLNENPVVARLIDGVVQVDNKLSNKNISFTASDIPKLVNMIEKDEQFKIYMPDANQDVLSMEGYFANRKQLSKVRQNNTNEAMNQPISMLQVLNLEVLLKPQMVDRILENQTFVDNFAKYPMVKEKDVAISMDSVIEKLKVSKGNQGPAESPSFNQKKFLT